MMECKVSNMTVKKIEKNHSSAWKWMKYAHDALFANDDKNILGNAKVNKKWTLSQIEKVERFDFKNEDDEELDNPTMFRIDFKFVLSDCRVITGTVRNTMPCSCCFKWTGTASVKAD